MRFNARQYGLLVSLLFALTVGFQNCAQSGFEVDMSSLNEIQGNALPPADSISGTEQNGGQPTPTPTPSPSPSPGTSSGNQISVALHNAEAKQGFKLVFRVSTDQVAAKDIELAVKTVQGTAVAGVDFVPQEITVKIEAGKSFVDIPVETLAFAPLLTSDKKMVLKIVRASGAQVAIAESVGTILATQKILDQFTQVAAGIAHSCGLVNDGRVMCWGLGISGQLGLGSGGSFISLRPNFVSGLTNASQIATGSAHSCAVLNDATVKCWGSNAYGQLGVGSIAASYTPILVENVKDVSQLVLGQGHSCALLKDATVKCWGDNRSGQLGVGDKEKREGPVQVAGLSNVVQIASGVGHSCALLKDGTVKCWGASLGGASTVGLSSSPVLISGLGSASQISVGSNSACVLLKDSTVKCWQDTTKAPVAINGLNDVSQVSVGFGHSCALLKDQTVKCWGNSTYGAGGALVTSEAPATVSGLKDVSQISLGNLHSCALKKDKTIFCWGSNNFGNLGNMTEASAMIFVPKPELDSGRIVSMKSSQEHTCIIKKDATVACRGVNQYGQLGNGSNTSSLSFQPVSGLTNVTQISLGQYHSCALLKEGSVKCWGAARQLGNGKTDSSNVPVAVTGLSNVKAISSGWVFTCALMTNGTVSCWGDGVNKDNRSTDLAPAQVAGLNEVTAIGTGTSHACALLANKTVKCWGSNPYGVRGNGKINDGYADPAPVSGLIGVKSLSVTAYYSCALLENGKVACWGYNAQGQLGDKTRKDSVVPIMVAGLDGATQIALGQQGGCALKADSSLYCWGSMTGFITPPNGSSAITPIPANITAIDFNYLNLCVLDKNGHRSCLGVLEPISPSPVPVTTLK